MTVAGNLFIPYNEYIDLAISQCSNLTHSCATQEEIDQTVNNMYMTLILKNQYFDFDDLDNPIKNYLQIQRLYFRSDTLLLVTVSAK